MPKKMLFYSALVFIVANLTYDEYLGLNAVFIATLYVLLSSVTHYYEVNQMFLKSWKWWCASLLFIANGCAIFYMNTELSAWMFVVSFFFYVAVLHDVKISLPTSILQSIHSIFSGFYHVFEWIISRFTKKEGDKKSKRMVQFLLYTIPILICLVFLKLYQSADETFYEWTKFINLDWISWSFILFYCLIFILFYGLFFYLQNNELNKFDQSLKNDIPSNYSDKIANYMGLENEKKIAISILVTLNLMLLLYNFIDLKFVLVDLQNPSPNLRYSGLLHGGVNSLITSIILVIFILMFLFRGQLNFRGNKFIKSLAIVWLAMNLVMIATTVVKNHEYISHWGLTYKRIGVYIYLLLATLGLVFTIIKIVRIKSLWYLIRNTSIGFLTCFTVTGFINWDKIIVQFNLNAVAPEKIDFYYLSDLGDDAYPSLIAYYNNHKKAPEITDKPNFWNRTFHKFDATKYQLERKAANTTWRSTNIREQLLLAEMKRYNLTYKHNSYR